MPDHINNAANSLARRRWAGALLMTVAGFSGCGWLGQSRVPGKFPGFAAATPLPQSYSQPPVEPPPAPAALPPAPPHAASVALESPPIETLPPVAVETSSPPATEEIEALKADIAQLKSRQESTQSALESLTASSLATANRAAAIEAHLALQSSLIDDLRTAAQQQQREQLKALDAVSEGLDRMLKKSNQEQKSAPASPPASESPRTSPGDIPLHEFISQHPDAAARGVR